MITDKQVLDILRETGALLEGHFILSSGLHSAQYFQCAKALQYPKHLVKLCKPIAVHFLNKRIDVVASPALGGVVVGTEVGRQMNVRTIFAERTEGAMKFRRGFEIKPGERVLIVEDVITTGKSVREVMRLVEEAGGVVAGVACIVDRSDGTVKLCDEQFSLLKLHAQTYEADKLPPELAAIPATKPGSRVQPNVS
ncbi:MAG: orotate phosphoribosyltransferase [Chloroherpetonaceae bacterium]|nr:orotate phosphoribosyltransferase [Chloroherpetonaceae bacterium]MDW8436643.1 orotate phosphoribosyltransferase [Chloroherpetonaceae bacterium]